MNHFSAKVKRLKHNADPIAIGSTANAQAIGETSAWKSKWEYPAGNKEFYISGISGSTNFFNFSNDSCHPK
jgi:hypothetical protein